MGMVLASKQLRRKCIKLNVGPSGSKGSKWQLSPGDSSLQWGLDPLLARAPYFCLVFSERNGTLLSIISGLGTE